MTTATRLDKNIRYRVTLQPAAPRRYFTNLSDASVTDIRMTWQSLFAWMNTQGRQLIDSSWMDTCECCGGPILVGEKCLWVKGHVIHVTSDKCVAEQVAMDTIRTNREKREKAHREQRAMERCRHEARVRLGTLTMTLALPAGDIRQPNTRLAVTWL